VQDHPTVRLEAQVPRELAERFRRIASDADRSARAHLRTLIREAVETSEAAPAGGSAKTADAGGRRVEA
jgi:predicted transcriptional regulator